jgi:hypothetical protein
MKEPKRLLRADATGLERLLLEAAGSERPLPDQRLRMRIALGLPVSGLAATGIKAAAAAWGHAALFAVVAAGMAGSMSQPELPRAQGNVGFSVIRPSSLLPAHVTEPAPVASAANPVAPEPTPMDRPKPAGSSNTRASTPSDLREEIRLLDQAREALRHEAPTRALERLGHYAVRFPRGSFRQEAMVLRIEALARSGERARARVMADRFLAEHPESPHADRVARSVSSSGP